jgi:predicted membrane-bound spermidine synthase
MPGNAVLSIAFLLSGAAGLIFQIVWFHRAGLVLGSSLWAVTVVLSSFMGGLAIGNAVAMRYGHRVRRPLVAYAGLELLIALTGMIATLTLPRLAVIIIPLARLVPESSWQIETIRLASAFVTLVVPTIAMGTTLPLLVGEFRRRGVPFGTALGRLYGWNTLGAVAGVLVADVVLIQRLGIGRTAWVAALLNVTAAMLAWLSARGSQVAVQALDIETVVSRTERQWMALTGVAATTSRGSRLLLACAFLSGGLLLALEVLWFRFLSLYVLSTTLAASLMLAAVLSGIAAGGFLASFVLKKWPAADQHVPAAACVTGLALIGSYAAFQTVTSGTQVGEWTRVLWFACALVGPTALMSGVFFTWVGDALHRRLQPDTRAAASLTLSNTLGALCGPPLAAFVLLPVLGMERAFFALALGYAGVGVLALGVTTAATRARRLGLAAFGLLVAALLLFPFGVMRARYFPRAADAYALDGSTVVATREGASATIFLMQQQWMGHVVYNRLVTNGFSMTGTAVPGMRYMRYFAYWPMLLHQRPIQRALVVCYGVGVTAGAVLQIPSLTSLDVVEISPDVVAMSDVIYSPEEHPLHDPRAHLHLEDGRYFLETTTERFDLITGEPPPPRTPGTVNIYTREYFQSIYDHLNEGGMTTYWVPVARPDPGTDVDTVIRAFCDVFDDCSLWNATPFDLMLVGTRGALHQTALEDFTRPWQTPGLQAALRDVGFERPEQIGATFLGDAPYLKALTAGTPPLTDDFPQRLRPSPSRPSLSDPRVSPNAAAAADRFQRLLDPARAAQLFAHSDFIASLWPPEMVEKSLPYFDYQRVLNEALWEGGQPLVHIGDLHAVLTGTSLRTLPLWMLGTDDVKQRIAESVDDGAGTLEYARGVRGLTGRDYLAAAEYFRRAEERGLRAAPVRALRAYALYAAGQLDDARALAHAAEPRTDEERRFWKWIEDRSGMGD